MANKPKPILDATCGARMMWFDKQNPMALFVDRREVEPIMVGIGRNAREFSVSPDVVADFTNLPFDNNSFPLVVFDPPHFTRAGDSSYMAIKYGKLGKDWREVLKAGFDEYRVTIGGTMRHKTRLIAAVLAVVLVSCTFFIAACAPANEVVLASTPEPTVAATATATPTLSPAPTPTLAPSPTPMPELTYEQKKALLGIDEDFQSHLLGSLIAVELSSGNIAGRIWGLTYSGGDDPSKHDFHSVCNDEYLFTLDLTKPSTGIFEYPDYLYKSSNSLKNLTLTNSTGVAEMARTYDLFGISYNDCQEIKDIYARFEKDPNGTINSPISKEQIIDLIIKSTPQEKIIPFWVYTPGATIPDELKGIYSEADYPPAPAE